MPPRFLIFGDSHSGTLMRAAQSMGLDFAGGSIMAGQNLNRPFFTIVDGALVMSSALGRQRLAVRLQQTGLGPNLLDADMPILSTVGFNTNNFESLFRAENLAIRNSPGSRFISMACFEAVVLGARLGAFEFYRTLRAFGKTVFAVRSPQRFAPSQAVVCHAFEEIVARQLAGMGVRIVDVRAETTDETGALRPEFARAEAGDRVHGNNDYGKAVLNRFTQMLAAA